MIDKNFNMYAASLEFTGCAARLSAPDGDLLTGLATIDDSTSPETLIIGVADVAGTNNIALYLSLNRT